MMKDGKSFADRLRGGDFIVTAEFLPRPEADGAALRSALGALAEVPSAVNVSDNPHGVAMSSMAASVILAGSGVEPIYQVLTRDRNRIAIQSDLLGAASLGIKNLLCLSGYHQALTDNPGSANVYDIDSTQLVAMVKKMRDGGELVNGAKIAGTFGMTAGAVANPYMKPLELNLIRLGQKVDSGADFIQTHAVFDAEGFGEWLEAARKAGITGKTAIIAGVMPLKNAEEAEALAGKFTDYNIPASIIERLKSAGDGNAQKKEGIAICVEMAKALKGMQGLRGIHIHSGGKEETIPEILTAAGLSGK